MNEANINVGIIGFGKLGLLHASIFNALPGVHVSTIVESSQRVRAMMGRVLPDINFVEDIESLPYQSSSINACIVAAPTAAHIPICMRLADKNFHFLVEKPLSLRSQDCLPLIQMLQSKNNLVTKVGYMYRFYETIALAKKIIDSNCLGTLQSLRCTMYVGQVFGTGKGWRYEKKASGGGVLITQNSHLLDILLWIFGEVNHVSAHKKHIYSQEVEDEVHAYFQFKRGLSGWLDASWSKRHARTLTIQVSIQGSKGTLDFDEDAVHLYIDEATQEYSRGWSEWKKPDLFQPCSIDIAGSHYSKQAIDFIEHVRGEKRSVGASIEESFYVQQLIDAIYSSCDQNGATVTLAQERML